MKSTLLILSLILVLTNVDARKIKVLIVDGQNNHVVWPKSTIMMKQYLEAERACVMGKYKQVECLEQNHLI